MYFHYPMWYGSMPDPSMAPPPPGFFPAQGRPMPPPPRPRGHYFKPEGSRSFQHEEHRPHVRSYADDDIGVDYTNVKENGTSGDYGPEYVHPKPYPPPPPPNPPERAQREEEYYDLYTRMNGHPPPGYSSYPHSRSHPYPYAPPYGFSSYSRPHTHTHTQWYRYSHPRQSWSSQEGLESWRAKQKKVWEEWENWQSKTKGKRHPHDQTGRGERRPPHSSGPTSSDEAWHEDARGYARYAQDDSYTKTQRERYQSWEYNWYQPPSRPDAQAPSYPTISSDTVLTKAFDVYGQVWATLLSPGGENPKPLAFRNIPWPQWPPPRSAEDIDARQVRAFLAAGGRGLKVCLREALLRFHPDKTTTLLARVLEKDKADVAAACEAVTRVLGQLLKSATL